MSKQPHVDRFGILRVPWLPGQAISTWDAYDFEADRKGGWFWRSVDKPRKSDGKTFKASAWLNSATKHWEELGGHWDGEERIADRDASVGERVVTYWELQDRCCWGAEEAWSKSWKPQQYAANVCKRFGILDRTLKNCIHNRAKAIWTDYTYTYRTERTLEPAGA